MDEAARRAILSRRRRFVVAAVATLGQACDPAPDARTCLSTVVTIPPAEGGMEPVIVEPPPSVSPSSEPAPTVAPEQSITTPSVCLHGSVPLPSADAGPSPPLPRVCLRY